MLYRLKTVLVIKIRQYIQGRILDFQIRGAQKIVLNIAYITGAIAQKSLAGGILTVLWKLYGKILSFLLYHDYLTPFSAKFTFLVT